MLIARFATPAAPAEACWGLVEGDVLRHLAADPFGQITPTEETSPLAAARLLTPTEPSKVIAVANNYLSHLAGEPVPTQPEPFFKSPTSVIGPGAAIVIPPGAQRVESEAEMVVVIGRTARQVSPAQAPAHVLGISCGNDVSERAWQGGDIQWWRAKGADTFAPYGPYIATGLDHDDRGLTCRVNGEIVQQQRTKDLLFGVAAIVSFISQAVTLHPGDIVLTGTPGSAARLRPGDRVCVEVEGVGVLENPVAASAP